MKKLLLLLFMLLGTSAQADESFNKVLSQYEELHQAFFENKLEKVHESAKKVLSSLEAIKDEKLAKPLTYTRKKLQEVSTAKTLEEGHEAFNTVSQGILLVLEKHAPNGDYARYYCPMVKKYWIQNVSQSEKVMNPYASSTMPHCGGKK